MDHNTFSIITPSLNSLRTINRCVESVRNIRIPLGWKVEHLIIDGGSTDGTINFVQSKNYTWIKLLVGVDLGIYFAMNKGLTVARGTFFTVLNSDDALREGILESLVEEYNDKPNVEFLLGGSLLHYSNGESRVYNPNFEHLKSAMVPHPSMIFSMQPIEGRTLFDTRFKIAADYDYALKRIQESSSKTIVSEVFSDVFIGGYSERPENRLLSILEREEIRKRHKISSNLESAICLIVDYCKVLVKRNKRTKMFLGFFITLFKRRVENSRLASKKF